MTLGCQQALKSLNFFATRANKYPRVNKDGGIILFKLFNLNFMRKPLQKYYYM